MAKKKDFTVAVLLFLFVGFFGAHRVYVKETVAPIFWYPFAVFFTIGIIYIFDIINLKKMIQLDYEGQIVREKLLKL